MPRVIPPAPDSDDRYFWDGVAQGRLLLQRCADCATLRHPPSPMCGNCLSLRWDTQAATGRGVVYSWIVSRHPTLPDEEPRIVVLVALEEGVRIVANLQGVDAADVRNDMALEVVFMEVDGVVLPQFRPARGEA